MSKRIEGGTVVRFRVGEDELERLDHMVRVSGHSRSSFLRFLVRSVDLKPLEIKPISLDGKRPKPVDWVPARKPGG